MKVVSSSPDRLIVDDRPVLMAGFLWVCGTMMIAAALLSSFETASAVGLVRTIFFVFGCAIVAIAWRFFPFQRFVFDRPRGTFDHRSARLAKSNTVTIDLADVKRVRIEKIWGEAGWMDRVVLDLGSTVRPLESSYSGSSRAAIVREINEWLSDPARPGSGW